MRRKVVSSGLAVTLALGLTGCGGSSEIAQLNNLQALNSESTVNSYSLTTSEKEEAIYAQVVERQLLDLTTLDACTDNEKQQVLQFMNNVDAQLCGTLKSEDGVISKEYTDYLLMEFEKTPYYWQRSKTTIRGIDSKSRSIIVDVEYKTIDYNKTVQGASYLVQGEENYDQKMQIRYSRWMSILDQKYRGKELSWESEYQKFKENYGDPADIFDTQRNLTLTETVFETGNQKTYSGLLNSDEENSHATMVVRFVLTPSYVLGINTGMICNHMYKVSYLIDNDCTEGRELFKDEGYATISDNIYSMLYSYFNCIDESDYSGLYSLTKDFGDIDKYYSDYFETTYRKHEGFTVSLFSISGTKVECGVSVSSKVRAKGANMTYPIYTDRYFVKLELVEDGLKVNDLVLLSSVLEGEPAISTSNAEVSGFVSSIDLDNQDKKDIENLIANFGAVQLLSDTSSDDFGNIVDISISQSQLTDLKKNMTLITGVKKVVWLVNYMQGTPNYSSVKCKELYQKDDNSIIEADVTYNFINKGDKWYIYSYDINSSSKLDTTNLTVTGSLCVCTAGKVDVLNSQIINTNGSQTSNGLESIGITYEHDSYTPVLKTGSVEGGLVKLTPDTLTDAKRAELYNHIVKTYGDESMLNLSDLQGVAVSHNLTGGTAFNTALDSLICLYYNYTNNRFSDLNDFTQAQTSTSDLVNSYDKALRELNKSDDAQLNGFVSSVDKWSDWVSGMKYN